MNGFDRGQLDAEAEAGEEGAVDAELETGQQVGKQISLTTISQRSGARSSICDLLEERLFQARLPDDGGECSRFEVHV